MPHLEVNLILGVFPLLLSLHTHHRAIGYHRNIRCRTEIRVIAFLIFKYWGNRSCASWFWQNLPPFLPYISHLLKNENDSSYGCGDLRYLCILCHRSTWCHYYYQWILLSMNLQRVRVITSLLSWEVACSILMEALWIVLSHYGRDGNRFHFDCPLWSIGTNWAEHWDKIIMASRPEISNFLYVSNYKYFSLLGI